MKRATVAPATTQVAVLSPAAMCTTCANTASRWFLPRVVGLDAAPLLRDHVAASALLQVLQTLLRDALAVGMAAVLLASISDLHRDSLLDVGRTR